MSSGAEEDAGNHFPRSLLHPALPPDRRQSRSSRNPLMSFSCCSSGAAEKEEEEKFCCVSYNAYSTCVTVESVVSQLLGDLVVVVRVVG